jgi:hypothetical protein
LPPLLAILDRYQSEPVIAESIAALGALASQPLPVFEHRYAQVPASVDEVASWVADQRSQKQLAESTIPIVLTVAGGALLLLGSTAMMVRAWRRSR